jgi:hypothetical protein
LVYRKSPELIYFSIKSLKLNNAKIDFSPKPAGHAQLIEADIMTLSGG